ncbi:glycoside hydrolase family 9 protein [Micromonospora cathayae]|uniref:Endoglucanase n=1 Tax=Micromonospora cathayae TaxID=3028804 RepID=A0ABY7ZPW6_9ACTN|nr:glycoside hydrolase family 9 protein [Micromonospora sp. HUAS 3]WDZ84543.1 glycoside hydrolase family 9 protein [Micromonospora sp. HUAS 3]
MSRPPGRRRAAVRTAAAAAVVALAATAVLAPAAHAAPDPGSIVKVNQVAYVPGLPKQATIVSGSGSPIAWTLRNAAGSTVASGQTTVRGADSLSGDSVHIADFSGYDTVGTGYVLSAGGAQSYPFDISAAAVRKLRYDALAFFYHQRSGTPIEAQYVGNAYARPAGHLNVAPNRGDNNVPCRVSCGYTMDVRGGWYDAGDHGKYGVNTGIAAWQLINQYERTLHVAGADRAALADGTLAIPERGNGVPDILDEARWGVEFLMKMQIPTGRTDAGMVRHKVSDENWTALPTRPEQDAQPRVLAAPSTAATLNLAATAAQAARVWKTIDPTFADRALTAATRAYTAAKANPTRYADPNDTNGSGTYADNNVSDEFYWAAAELYATTGASNYRTDVTGSPHFRGTGFATHGFEWWWTAGLGDVTLAMVPNGLASSDVSATRNAIASYADQLLTQANRQGYPVATHSQPLFVWGSNGIVANAGNVLALAYDFTGQQKYRAGVYQTLDYLFGRNPYNQSYVAGYGERATRNVHHRFWANQVDASLPTAPAGSLAGGPNHELQDPYAQAQLAGCRPQKCYIDHIEAYSVNEVTINWNSALAWLANWAAEKAGDGPPATPDTTAPSTPGTPTASNVTSTGVTLTWPASTDAESGVTGYEVRRISGGTATVVASPGTASATLTGLSPATTYTFAVVAKNGAGLVSAQSPSVQVTTASGNPPGNAGCTVVYAANSWSNGFTANVTVTNTGSAAWTGWTVGFAFANGQTVGQAWSGIATQSGSQVTVRNESYNGAVAAGASVSFGFNGTHSGTNTNPTVFTVNGTTCA